MLIINIYIDPQAKILQKALTKITNYLKAQIASYTYFQYKNREYLQVN